MEKKEKVEGILSPYRVLDLTDEKGLLCGKLLGDLGADVIKIERPGGDPARNIGPFYHDEPDPEKSLFWFAFNTSKRGITLDINTIDGQQIFKNLVKSADFVIESFAPGYMDKLVLGYAALEKCHPGIIMVSITPFGQTGPYKDFKDSGIVAAALGGMMDQYDEIDRPPTWIGYHPQAYLLGAMEAAGGAMMALYHRGRTGKGQHVDVSIQEAVARQPTARRRTEPSIYTSLSTPSKKERGKDGSVKEQDQTKSAPAAKATRIRRIWPCKDGYVILVWWAGPNSRRWNMPLVDWIDREGMAGYLKEYDWDSFNWSTVTQEEMDRIEEPTQNFFLKHTKAELLEGALKNKAMVYPVSTSADTLQSVQLAAREFWVKVEHPELGTSITYPGPFGIFSETPARISRRAPLIGEHNKEIYETELGLSTGELLALKQAGII